MKSSIYLPLTVTDIHLSTAKFCTYIYTLLPLFLFLYFACLFHFLQVSRKPREEPLWGCTLPGPNKSKTDKTKWPHSGRQINSIFSGVPRESPLQSEAY